MCKFRPGSGHLLYQGNLRKNKGGDFKGELRALRENTTVQLFSADRPKPVREDYKGNLSRHEIKGGNSFWILRGNALLF